MNRRLAMNALLLLGFLGAIAIYWAARDAGPRPDTGSAVREGEGARAAEEAVLRGAPSAGEDPRQDGAVGGGEERVLFRGDVADEAGGSVAGASVRIRVPGATAGTTTTDADGRFGIEVDLPPGEGPTYGVLLARHPVSGVAVRSVILHPDPSWPRRPFGAVRDVGPVVLLPAHAFDVQVVSTCAGAPPARVLVRQAGVHQGAPVLVLETDGEGRAHVDGLPAGTWRLVALAEGCGRGSVFATLPFPDGQPVPVEIGPERIVAVEVFDEGTGAPVEGATVVVNERIERPTGIVRTGYVPAPLVPPTDRAGRTAIPGLAENDVLELEVRASGYPAPSLGSRDAPGRVRLAAGETEVRVGLVASRAITWRVLQGDVPVPADGTEIRLRPEPGAHASDVPASGRMANGALVVEGWGAGHASALAETPDGAVAHLYAEAGATQGRPLRFLHTRTVTVTLRYPDGEPAAGFYAVVKTLGNHPLNDPVETDAHGVARVTGLVGDDSGEVHVAIADVPLKHGLVTIGTVDLRKGDGHLEATVYRRRQLALRLRLDGEPVLPRSFLLRMGAQRYGAEHVERDEVTGTLRFAWRPWSTAPEVGFVLEADGYLTTGGVFPVSEGTVPLEATVALERGGPLVLTMDLPPDGFNRVQVQIWNEEKSRWDMAFDPRSETRAPDRVDASGEVRFGPLRPGRYRIVERYVGLATEAVDLVAGVEPAVLHLDLSRVVEVKGRVEVPEGFSAHFVTVRAEGLVESIDDSLMRRRRGPRWIATHTKEGGVFTIRLPGDRTITLVPYAGLLRAADVGGRAEILGARDDVVLRLVPAAVATFTYDRAPAFVVNPGKPRPVSVYLYEGEPEGEPAHRLAAMLEGREAKLSGFPPGTWTVWIDAQPFAPVVLRDVVFGDDDVDLGTIETSDGSTFVANVPVEEGMEPPHYTVSVKRQDEPVYHRSAWGGKGGEVRVTGIGRGRFGVRVTPDSVGPELSELIEFDGTTDVVRTLGP